MNQQAQQIAVAILRHGAHCAVQWILRRRQIADAALGHRIDAAGLRALEPALSHDFKAAILLKDQARVTSPGRLGAVLAERFARQGGEILRETVKALIPGRSGGWTCVTETTRHTAPKLVVSMGVWSAELLKPLGLRFPLESERGYHLSFADPGVSLTHSVMDMDMKFVASSMDDGLRVAGTAEFSGLDAPISEKRAAGLAALAQSMLPDMRTDKATKWSGQRPSLPDSLPCIGEIEGHPGLIAAFGHSHYGLMMAPKTGRIVADIVSGTPPNIDLSPYNPLRF
ncbi:NAD(P)/FAD-dependent oxidoreductase [Roseobacter sp. HKCCA2468]|uniref:NAD(P)/FAD-dependent oxidoreductase n=1 Tax=Roseobacter sp. HKCCA2468 TaxID=3120342 RepID=UPI0030EE1653